MRRASIRWWGQESPCSANNQCATNVQFIPSNIGVLYHIPEIMLGKIPNKNSFFLSYDNMGDFVINKNILYLQFFNIDAQLFIEVSQA